MGNPCVRLLSLFDKAVIPCDVEAWEDKKKVNYTIESELRYCSLSDKKIV
jgi:hypothetical protein